MNKILWFGAGAIALGGALWAYGTFSTNTVRTIAVTGECLTTAPKDRTAITLRVTTLDKSASVSMKMATAQVAEINEFLKTQNVESQTTEFNSYQKTEWNHTVQKSENMGIETTIALDVSADNIETIEKILSRFGGVPNIFAGNLRMYTSSETMKPILEQCLGIATQNARSRANALASGDGLRAGRLLSVSYGMAPVAQPRPTNFLRSAKQAIVEDALDSVAGGTLMTKDTEISVSVSAVFEIR